MSVTLMTTILIVEDNSAERELICHYLREGGYNVITAIGAQEALNLACDKKPDAIITDVVMPGMSGFELCRKLKQTPDTEKIPIVICSSKNQEIDRLWGMKQGANAYITKPFNREDLIRAVKSVSV
jgi:two-component system, chemotaxis family, response regulator PixH